MTDEAISCRLFIKAYWKVGATNHRASGFYWFDHSQVWSELEWFVDLSFWKNTSTSRFSWVQSQSFSTITGGLTPKGAFFLIRGKTAYLKSPLQQWGFNQSLSGFFQEKKHHPSTLIIPNYHNSPLTSQPRKLWLPHALVLAENNVMVSLPYRCTEEAAEVMFLSHSAEAELTTSK